MLTDLCQELKNWFDRGNPKLNGVFSIHDGDIFHVYNGREKPLSELGLNTNQYFRIIGSAFSDGVAQYKASNLPTEQFYGAVWFMSVPLAVILLDKQIEEWKTKYGEASLSPFTSESFGGYSYSKGATSSDGNPNTWRNVFKSELNKWRKI